jgi:hypothetical protein
MGDHAGLLIAGTDDVYLPLDGTQEVHRLASRQRAAAATPSRALHSNGRTGGGRNERAR